MTAALATTGTTSALTNLWRLRLASRQVLLLAKLRRILVTTFRPGDVDGSMNLLAPAASQWITAAQAAAQTDTLLYLTHLVESGELLLASAEGLVGVDAVGRPLGELVEMGGSMFKQRAGAGMDVAANTTGLLRYLNSIGSTEPYRTANGTVLSAADSNPRYMTGRINRITRAGCCDFCANIADRGYSPASAGFQAHRNCHCMAGPEVTSYVSERAERKRAANAARRG